MISKTNKEQTSSLNGKDLIHVGIYSAIYFAVIMTVAMLGYIPIMMPLLCVIAPILGGIPFMLFMTKVRKFGMIIIMSLIMGIMMLLTGMGLYALPVALVSGLIAELVWKLSNYTKAKGSIVAYGLFSLWIWGNFIPLFTNPASYFSTRAEFGKNYELALLNLLPAWMNPVLFFSCFFFGILGGYLGKSILKKHFSQAGII